MPRLRKFRSYFSKKYKLIDTRNRIYNEKKYNPNADKFFEKARELQEAKGLSQEKAVKMLHDSFVIKDKVNLISDSSISQKRKNKAIDTYENTISKWIDDDYYDEFYDMSEYLIDYYEG